MIDPRLSSGRHLRIDLGCGSHKKPGTIGIDIQPLPGVDIVLDLDKEPLPFEDQSVAYVYSNHFLEHTTELERIFSEISRVCEEGAQLELWTPYAGSNSGFVLGHKIFFTEDIYLHMCVWYLDFWEPILKAHWILEELHYVVEPRALVALHRYGLDLDFGLRNLRNMVVEFGAFVTVRRGPRPAHRPVFRRTFSVDRFGTHYAVRDGGDEPDPRQLQDALAALGRGGGPLAP